MGDKVAILGTVMNSRIVVPYDDPSWDVWVCSGGNSQKNAPPRITEWFELHALVDLHSYEHQQWYQPYVEWLRRQTFPIWMQEKNDDIPQARVFPYRKLIDRFGPNPKKGLTNWFTSSPAWMFAYAIERGYKTIGVFGVDMAAAEEHYTGQKAGLLRWFEIGRTMGIKVIVPLESTLAFDYPLYGYAEASRAGRAMIVRETELKNRIQMLQQQGAAMQRDLAYYQGQLEQVVFDRRTYITNPMDPEIDYELDPVPAELSQMRLAPATAPVQVIPAPPIRTEPVTEADFPDNPDAVLLSKRRRKSNGPAQGVIE